MALGYLGKNYLWAGSPLMKNGAQTGGANTYDYDIEYAKKAAEAFGRTIGAGWKRSDTVLSGSI